MAVVLIGLFSALATIGALTLPGDVLFGWLLLGAGAGILVAFGASRLRRGRATARSPDLVLGAATAAIFVTACLVLVGLLTTLGGGLTTAVLLLLVAGGLAVGYHHRVAPPTVPEPLDSAAPRPVPPVTVADLATEDLCVAWRRSYFLLLAATDERARRLVVQRRQDFLDEIERRDRSGFLRWLDSGAKAGSDPSPYLGTRS
ncbi:hypothetical protein AB0F15_21770 [Amycolatopsis sp. NPDC026612]|uniref:hypothetical protein n=1 Tax=Amycolatopsis sp. NPDC026612 TaxID=3155466 RepID=UPI0033DD530E